MMQAQIQKWGNSLAVRIPKAFADEIGLEADSLIELRLEDGRIVLLPQVPAQYNLDDLLSQITDDNRHDEVDTSPATGNEVW